MRQGTKSGTTTDAYVEALSLNIVSKKAIAIQNTGVNDMLVTIKSRHHSAGTITFDEAADYPLTAGSSMRFIEEKSSSLTSVQVKSNVAGNPTTYLIEYDLTGLN